MEAQELQEHAEHAHHAGEKGIGLTTAVVGVLMAVATMLGHRAHTREVVLQTEVNDKWGYYQAKNIRSHMYAADAKLAKLMPNGETLVEDFAKDSEKQKKDAEEIRKDAEKLTEETHLMEHKANFFDFSELAMVISVVLCSIALLSENKMFWKLSFITTLVGVGLGIWGLMLH